MNYNKLAILALIIALPHALYAQSSGTSLSLCLNKSTQTLSIKATCSKTETVVSGKNILTSTSINYDSCYQTSAKKSGSNFDGRVAVGILCKQKTDLLLNDQFSTTGSSGAKPVLESKHLVFNGKIPNGVEYSMLASGGVNKFYEVQITAVCCPTIQIK